MRTIDEAREGWNTLFNHVKTIDDLKKTLKSEDQGNLCDESLRSVCWKALLVYDNLDQSTWPYQISYSRSAYASLRDHFLKYIEHPDNLQCAIDPLAEDEESPWQSLRRDESMRAEINQDVERCLQEHLFFRQSSTKSMMLDILFIYSKLNPDLGYRQGMHELLAPVLWVMDQDAIDKKSLEAGSGEKYDDLILQSLDTTYIEHDSFVVFCSMMQTVRVHYEHSDQKPLPGQVEIAPIVSRCQHIHQTLLMAADYSLAKHLIAMEILPQIFLTRWMRLLFGREFPFQDVLLIWDLLFADGLRLDLIDFTCVAMLLRIRWQLLDADYYSALSSLLRYPPLLPHGPQTIVHDGLYLEQNLTPERGAFIISKYSGRPLEPPKIPQNQVRPIPRKTEYTRREAGSMSEGSSPGRSPVRVNFETLFHDVSEGLQRRAESWGVAKAIRGAMTEARRSVAQTDSSINMPRSWNSSRLGSPNFRSVLVSALADPAKKTEPARHRSKILAGLLGEAVNELRLIQERCRAGNEIELADSFDQVLTKVQSVQGCLENPFLPTPAERNTIEEAATILQSVEEDQGKSAFEPPSAENRTDLAAYPCAISGSSFSPTKGAIANVRDGTQPVPVRPAPRSLLSESGFSWMLGEGTDHLSFISSASPPPDQSRNGDSRLPKHGPLFGNIREAGHGKTMIDGEGLVMSSLRGDDDSRYNV